MGKDEGYICSFCSKKFGRKWNAHRHNNDIHKGLTSIDYQLKKGCFDGQPNGQLFCYF